MEGRSKVPTASSGSSSRKEVRLAASPAKRRTCCLCCPRHDSSSDSSGTSHCLPCRTAPGCNSSYTQTETTPPNEVCYCNCAPCSVMTETCCCESCSTPPIRRSCDPPPICSCPPLPQCTCQSPFPCSYETCSICYDRSEVPSVEVEKKAKIKKRLRALSPPGILSSSRQRVNTCYRQPFYPSTPKPGFPPLTLPVDCFCPRTRTNSADPNARQWSATKLYVENRTRSISPINPIRLAPGTIFRDRATSTLNVRSLEIATGTMLSMESSRISSGADRGVSYQRTTSFRTSSRSPPNRGRSKTRSRTQTRKPGVIGGKGATMRTSRSTVSKTLKVNRSRISPHRRTPSPPSARVLPGGSFIMADVGPSSLEKSQDELLRDGQATRMIRMVSKCKCLEKCTCLCASVHRAVQCSSSCLAPRCMCCHSCVPIVSCTHCGTCTFPMCCTSCSTKEEPFLCHCCKVLLSEAPPVETLKQNISITSVRSKSSTSGGRTPTPPRAVSPERKSSSKSPSRKTSSRSVSQRVSLGSPSRTTSEVCCRSSSLNKCVGVPSSIQRIPCHVCCCKGSHHVHSAVSGHSIPGCTVHIAQNKCSCPTRNHECSVHITKSNCCVRFGQLDGACQQPLKICTNQTCRPSTIHKACSACFLHTDQPTFVIPFCRTHDCCCQTDCRDPVLMHCKNRCCHRGVQSSTSRNDVCASGTRPPPLCHMRSCHKACNASTSCSECRGHGVVLTTPTHVVYGDHWCGNYVCSGDTHACVRHAVVPNSKLCCCCYREAQCQASSICSITKCEEPCAQQPRVQFDIPKNIDVCSDGQEHSPHCDVIKICNCAACVAKVQSCHPCTPVCRRSIEVVECNPCNPVQSCSHCCANYRRYSPPCHSPAVHPCHPAGWNHCYNMHNHCGSGGVICRGKSYTLCQPHEFTCHAGECCSNDRWQLVQCNCGVGIIEDIGQCIPCKSLHDPCSCSAFPGGLGQEHSTRLTCAKSSKSWKAHKSWKKDGSELTSGNESEGEVLVETHMLVRPRKSLTLGKSHNAKVSDDDNTPRTEDDSASTPVEGKARLDAIGSFFAETPSNESCLIEHKADSTGNESANHPEKLEESCRFTYDEITGPTVNTAVGSPDREGYREKVSREKTKSNCANMSAAPQEPLKGETPNGAEELSTSSVTNDLPEHNSSYARLDSIGTSNEVLSKASEEAKNIVDILHCAPLEDSEKCVASNADCTFDKHRDQLGYSCIESAYASDSSDETLTNTELASHFLSSASNSENEESEKSWSHIVSSEAQKACHVEAPFYSLRLGHHEADDATWSHKDLVCLGCGNIRTSALSMTSREIERRPEILVTPCNDVRTTHLTKISHSIPTSSSLLVGRKSTTLSSMSSVEILAKKRSRQTANQLNNQGFPSTKSVFDKLLAERSHTGRSVTGVVQSKFKDSRPGVLHPLSKDIRPSSKIKMGQNQTGPNPVKSMCRPLTQPVFIQPSKRRNSNLAPPPVSWRLVKTFRNAPSSSAAKAQEIKQQPSGKKPLGSIKSLRTHESDSSSSKFSLPPLHCKAGSRFVEHTPAPAKNPQNSRIESPLGRPGSRYAIWMRSGRRRRQYPPKRGPFEWGLPTSSKNPSLASQQREKAVNFIIDLIHQAAMQNLERSLGMRIFYDKPGNQQQQPAPFGWTPTKVCTASINGPIHDLGHQTCVTVNSIPDIAVGCIPIQSSKMRPFRPKMNAVVTTVKNPQLHEVNSSGYDFRTCLEARSHKNNVGEMKWHRCGISHFCESNPPSPVYETKHPDDRMYKDRTYSPLVNEPCRVNRYGEAYPRTMRVWYPREEEAKPNPIRGEALPASRPRTAGDYLRAHWAELEELQPRLHPGSLSKTVLGPKKEADHQSQPNLTELNRSRTVLVQPFGHCPSPVPPPSLRRSQTGSSCGISCNAFESLTSITPVDDASVDLRFANCVSPAFLRKRNARNNANNSNNNSGSYDDDDKCERVRRSHKGKGHSQHSVNGSSFTSEAQNYCRVCLPTPDTVDGTDNSAGPAHFNPIGWDDEKQFQVEMQNFFETDGKQHRCRGVRKSFHIGVMREGRVNEGDDYEDLEGQSFCDITGNNNNNSVNSAGTDNIFCNRITGCQLYLNGRRSRWNSARIGSRSRDANNNSGDKGKRSEGHRGFNSYRRYSANGSTAADESDTSMPTSDDSSKDRCRGKREKKRHCCACPRRNEGTDFHHCHLPHTHKGTHGHCVPKDQGAACPLPALHNRCCERGTTSRPVPACELPQAAITHPCQATTPAYPWAREFHTSAGNPLYILPHRTHPCEDHRLTRDRSKPELVYQPHHESPYTCKEHHCRSHETKKECPCHYNLQAYPIEPTHPKPRVRKKFCRKCGELLKSKRDESTGTKGDMCPCCCHDIKAVPIRSRAAEDLYSGYPIEKTPRRTSIDAGTQMSRPFLASGQASAADQMRGRGVAKGKTDTQLQQMDREDPSSQRLVNLKGRNDAPGAIRKRPVSSSSWGPSETIISNENIDSLIVAEPVTPDRHSVKSLPSETSGVPHPTVLPIIVGADEGQRQLEEAPYQTDLACTCSDEAIVSEAAPMIQGVSFEEAERISSLLLENNTTSSETDVTQRIPATAVSRQDAWATKCEVEGKPSGIPSTDTESMGASSFARTKHPSSAVSSTQARSPAENAPKSSDSAVSAPQKRVLRSSGDTNAQREVTSTQKKRCVCCAACKLKRLKDTPESPPADGNSLYPIAPFPEQLMSAASKSSVDVDDRKHFSGVRAVTSTDMVPDTKTAEAVPLRMTSTSKSQVTSKADIEPQLKSTSYKELDQKQPSISLANRAGIDGTITTYGSFHSSDETNASTSATDTLCECNDSSSSEEAATYTLQPTIQRQPAGSGEKVELVDTKKPKPKPTPKPEKKKDGFCNMLCCCCAGGDTKDSDTEPAKTVRLQEPSKAKPLRTAGDSPKVRAEGKAEDIQSHRKTGSAESLLRQTTARGNKHSAQTSYSEDPKYRNKKGSSVAFNMLSTDNTQSKDTATVSKDKATTPTQSRKPIQTNRHNVEPISEIEDETEFGSQTEAQSNHRINSGTKTRERTANNHASCVAEQRRQQPSHQFSMMTPLNEGDLFEHIDGDDLEEESLHETVLVDGQVIKPSIGHMSSSELRCLGSVSSKSRQMEEKVPVTSYKTRRINRLTHQAAVLEEAIRATALNLGLYSPTSEATVHTDDVVLATFSRQKRSLPLSTRSTSRLETALAESEELEGQKHLSFKDASCEAMISLVVPESPTAADGADGGKQSSLNDACSGTEAASATAGAKHPRKLSKTVHTTAETEVHERPSLQENAPEDGTLSPSTMIKRDDKLPPTFVTGKAIRRHRRYREMASTEPEVPLCKQQACDSKPAQGPMVPRLAVDATARRRWKSGMNSEKPSISLHTPSPPLIWKGDPSFNSLPDPTVFLVSDNRHTVSPLALPHSDNDLVETENEKEAALLSRDDPSSDRPQPSACRALWGQIQNDIDRLDLPDTHQR